MSSSKTYTRRKSRQTGTHIIIAAPGLEACESEGWMLICDEHGQCTTVPTLRAARFHAADPMGWCEVCMENICPDCGLEFKVHHDSTLTCENTGHEQNKRGDE
jgi:hypothetical protein